LTRAALVSLGASAAALTSGCALLPKDHAEAGALDAATDDDDDAGDDDDNAPDGEAIDTGLIGTFYGSPIGMMVECSTAQDCAGGFTELNSGSSDAFCCVQEQCLVGQAALDVACADPEVQMIQASNYDQACRVDSDCMAISVGNFCIPGATNCPNAAINQSSKAHYLADVANTNAAFCSAPGNCSAAVVCGGSTGPWCVNGACTLSECPAVLDAGAACSGDECTLPFDAGGAGEEGHDE
jgi:hypothetical protein